METARTLIWHDVADVTELVEGTGISRKVGDERVALFPAGGKIYALRDLCPHAGSLLSVGATHVEGGTPVVVCPMHFWAFSLETGEAESDPDYRACTYPARIEGMRVLVGLPTDVRK